MPDTAFTDRPNPPANAPLALEAKPLALFGLAFSAILAGGLIGAGCNAVNGWVSPDYFVAVLRWQGVEDVWRACVVQGILEGLLTGFVFSVVFTTATGIFTGAACSYGFAVRYLGFVIAGTLALWAMGGAAAMGLASLSPEFWRRSFIGVPTDNAGTVAYAWVGGSLIGAQVGGFGCLILVLVLLRARWRKLHPAPIN